MIPQISSPKVYPIELHQRNANAYRSACSARSCLYFRGLPVVPPVDSFLWGIVLRFSATIRSSLLTKQVATDSRERLKFFERTRPSAL